MQYRNKYSSKDPVWILHRFHEARDIEVAGLITSCYCYGQVDSINNFIKKFLNRIDFKVHEFTVNYSERKDKKFLKDLNYRFNTENDLSLLLLNIKSALSEYKTLEKLFLEKYNTQHTNILPALDNFSAFLNKLSNENSYFSYLLPMPSGSSTCKRLNLYLRWMVRKDEIDIGVWTKIDKSKLIIPVDTHVYRIGRKLRMVKRKSCDLKFAIEMTEMLKRFDKDDPVKYDFALCHIGIDKKNPSRKEKYHQGTKITK